MSAEANAPSSAVCPIREADKGISATFAEDYAWWLQGQRWDTEMLSEMLGEDAIRELSTEFYTRVYTDDANPWFRDMFRRRATLQQSIDRQAAFFVQVWGGPKVYTSNHRPHILRRLAGDHTGVKMFAMHENVRARSQITEDAAKQWLQHMDGALLKLRPAWVDRHGEEKATMIEKSMRWFFDHVLERLVWGGPTKSWTKQRVIFTLVRFMTARYAVRDFEYSAKL